jgi:DNA-binding NtrC family response regulator
MSLSTKHCLLIVDDEPHVCDSVHDLLRREFRVLKAHCAEEGYELMRREEVHIIMSDQRMPKISGVELLTQAKSRHPQAIRLLFTGFADLDSIITAINHGQVFRFVKKPWQPEELEEAVRHAAAEYDRLSEAAEERALLRSQLDALHSRVAALEAQLGQLAACRAGP